MNRQQRTEVYRILGLVLVGVGLLLGSLVVVSLAMLTVISATNSLRTDP